MLARCSNSEPNIVYFGGHWEETFGSRPSARLQGVMLDDLSYHTDFEPIIQGGWGVRALAAAGQYLWAGGEITDTYPNRVRGFARFSAVEN